MLWNVFLYLHQPKLNAPIAVPIISRFYGLLISIYFERAAQHQQPHFHAEYGEFSASYAIDPPSRLAGEMPRRQERLILAWAELHQTELMENWQRAITGRRLIQIEGLR